MIQSKNITGFIGYRVDKDGAIWSCLNSNSCGGNKTYNWRKLKLGSDTNGYPIVTLRKNGRSYGRRVHNIVLEEFISPRPKGMVARHLDGNNRNPKLSNLVWSSQKENIADKKLHGTELLGEKNHKTKLNSSQVVKIRLMHFKNPNVSRIDIARKFGVDRTLISQIINRKIWKHIS